MPGINETLGGLFGAGGAADVQKLIGPVMELVQNSGGINGLLEQLKSNGLSEQVTSWVGTGPNAKVDPSALTAALGPDKVQALAAKAGVTIEQASSTLTALIPQMVDKLSPGGSIPGADQAAALAKKIPGAEGLTDQLTGKLSGLLGGSSTTSE